MLSSMVRRAVALNPNTSEAMLAKLANDPRPRCGTPWKAAAKHTIAVFCRANLPAITPSTIVSAHISLCEGKST